ncbi:MAG: ATP-binding protein [Zavarzinella sp.]|nr:ATP-binding protein [Zavarzinella sp.]
MHLTTQIPDSPPTAADAILHSETVHTPGIEPSGVALGSVEACQPDATNEHVFVRVPSASRAHAVRGRFVKIVDKVRGTRFLGRVIAGPFFPDGPDGDVRIKVEVEGELTGRRTTDTNDRPAAGSPVRALTAERVGELLGCAGDMRLGTLAGWDAVPVGLPSQSKDVLPRNVGIFGTVGSGKSNTAQVLVEEAAAAGWAVIVVDVEGEYVEMDEPADQPELEAALARHGRQPQGVPDFDVIHPASCASDRPDSRPFTLRLADFDAPVVTELIHATNPERNALMDCVEHFQNKLRTKAPTTETDWLNGMLDPSPKAPRPYNLQDLYDRARERSSKTTDLFDYLGLATKLLWLINSGAFDQPNLRSLDAVGMLAPGRVTVIDVSMANDTVKNLATADLLRKVFADKLLRADAPPTLVVIEEAHSFISREKAQAMQATLEMLRTVTRRGRKRWLATAFVSQQPGHLPPEIFELCNTRLVHNLRSMHNLDALMATTGDIAGELWARCPLLGTGEAIVSSPQLNRPAVVSMRPAASRRKFSR